MAQQIVAQIRTMQCTALPKLKTYFTQGVKNTHKTKANLLPV